jgi:hypothetical protein
MAHRECSVPAPRWLLPLLALLLVLGHACELPAYADMGITPHLTEGTGHDAADHGHEPQISCDPVDILASTGSVQVGQAGPDLGAAHVVPVASARPLRVVTASLEGSTRLPSRPPLFLLHASLLI